MFYLCLFLSIAMIITGYLIPKFKVKNKQKFKTVITKILKISVICLVALQFLSLFLPDAFVLNLSESEVALTSNEKVFAIVRWLAAINTIILPIAVFYKNRTIRNIAIYFCTLTTILSIAFYNTYIQYFTSTLGKGISSISFLSEGFKAFLINITFRSFLAGIIWTMQIIIPAILAVEEKHVLNVKNIKEIGLFFAGILFVLINCIPIYVPMHIFGYTNIVFSAWSIPHILWLLLTAIEMFVLYILFKNKDYETRKIICLILSLCLLFAFNQMFTAKGITIKKLPLQLCNLASYFILISLIFNSKKLFEFTAIINVAGVLFALLIPDLENKGLFYLYNMHFILEHTNILVVPILVMLFKIFPRFDKKSLKHCLIGFSIYFISVLTLGTLFNGLVKITGNNIFEANYLFMFDEAVAESTIKGISKLFAINFSIADFTFYPVIQGLIYLIFETLCILIYLTIKLIYRLSNKRLQKNNN